MIGGISRELESFYNAAGIADDNLLNRIKQRNVRIQLCLNGINLGDVSASSNDSDEAIQRVRSILANLKLN